MKNKLMVILLISVCCYSAQLKNNSEIAKIVDKLDKKTTLMLTSGETGSETNKLLYVYEIVLAARKVGVDPLIMIAQAYTESSFRSGIINKNEKGGRWSRGLFQIQARTAWEHCRVTKNQLLNPIWNIKCAAIIHKNNLLDKFSGDIFAPIKMLFAYNAGGYYMCKKHHHARKVDCAIGFPVNFNYLRKTIDHYIRLQPEFKKFGIEKLKSVDFLSLSQKYIDSLM